jgi:hypothetical protein
MVFAVQPTGGAAKFAPAADWRVLIKALAMSAFGDQADIPPHYRYVWF